MLQNWMSQNLFLYGMAAAGVLGLLCTLLVNRFYHRVIGDLRRMDVPKTKWMGQTLRIYRERTRHRALPNPEVFVRSQLNEGRILGASVSKWQRGTGYMCVACFSLMSAAVYTTYQYPVAEALRAQHVTLGLGIILGLLMLRQFLGFSGKEGQISDSLLDYMENGAALEAQQQPAVQERPEDRERTVLIDQVMQGIQQTAAAGTKFSGLLSKEEEQVMREVIKEYLA